MDSHKTRAIAALLLTMILWGSAAVFMRTLALSLTPENSLAVRYVLLTVVNVAGLLWLGTWRIPKAHWPRFLIAGIAGMAAYNYFVNLGFKLVPAGIGTIVTMIEPLMIALLAAMLLGEKLTRWVFLGVAMAIAGSIVLFWPDLTAQASAAVPLEGVIYLLICCLGWAIYTIVSKPLLDRYDSFTVTAVTMIIAAPLMIGIASEPVWMLAAKLDLRQWAEVLYLVFAGGIGGTLMWNYGTKYLSGTAAGTFLYLIPVVAVASGALILDEPVTVYVIAGGLLMLAGVAAAQFGPACSRGASGMDPRAFLALLFTVVVWGIGPVFLRSLSVDLGPSDHLVIRYGLVTIIYVVALAIFGGWRVERQDWPRLLVISVIGMVGYNLGSAFGFALVSAGSAA